MVASSNMSLKTLECIDSTLLCTRKSKVSVARMMFPSGNHKSLWRDAAADMVDVDASENESSREVDAWTAIVLWEEEEEEEERRSLSPLVKKGPGPARCHFKVRLSFFSFFTVL